MELPVGDRTTNPRARAVHPCRDRPGHGAKAMTRWLPHPWFALWLLVAWLLLQQSLAAPTIVLGIVLALALSWALGKLDLPRVRVRSPGTLLVLLARVFGDIVRSNIAVAKIIVSPRSRISSGFVAIPLEMTHPYALALLRSEE